MQQHTNDPLVIGGHTFTSRFILGSGKYSLKLIQAAVQDAGAELITLAVRRANTRDQENILDYIPKGVTLLPNTSGARNAQEAVRIARLQSAETNAPYDNAWVDIFGILADKKMRTTKRGDILALLTVEDMTGSMEVMCFGRVYSQVSAKLVPGEPLFFRGRVSLREEDDTKMVLERVFTIEERQSAPPPRPPPPSAVGCASSAT